MQRIEWASEPMRFGGKVSERLTARRDECEDAVYALVELWLFRRRFLLSILLKNKEAGYEHRDKGETESLGEYAGNS
jgi:hypothetical protein